MNGRDRGSVLVLALLVSAASAIAGMWMVLTSDLRARANRYLARAGDATRFAIAGLELARLELGNNSEWDGDTFPVGPKGGSAGTATVAAEPVGFARSEVSSVGALADTTQTVIAELRAPFDPSLEFNVVSGSTITIRQAVCGGHLRANGNVTTDGTIAFSGTLETTTGSSVSDAIASSQVAFVNGTLAPPPFAIEELLDFASPLVGVPFDSALAALLVDRTSLTPAFNPYGAENALGAYSLDAGGGNVVLRDLYVRGMLVIKNATLVTVTRGYRHERVETSLPTLVVQGALDLKLEASLDEPALFTDLNGDGDMLDSFPPAVIGIVRASGAMTLPYGGTIQGSALGSSVTIVGATTFSNDAQLATQPVRGYIEPGAYDIVAGTIGEG
jgi:hypothetical protein